jgi:hypothetical protein
MYHRQARTSRPSTVADAVLHVCVLSWVGMERGARRCVPRAAAARIGGQDRDRGDVPGWVLVTLMTAGLVTVLWVLARDRLTAVFDRAISSVAGP